MLSFKKQIIGGTAMLMGLSLIVLALFFGPFLLEQNKFKVLLDVQQTTIQHQDFGFSYTLQGDCWIEGQLLNSIAFDGYWLGDLICDESEEFNIFIRSLDSQMEQRIQEDAQQLEDMTNAYMRSSEDGGDYFLFILDEQSTKVFELSTRLTNEDAFYWIIESLVEVE